MALKSNNNLWESKFDNIVSKRGKLQDLISNQLKMKVHVTYKKDEKTTTNFEPTDEYDDINKTYLHEKLKKDRRSSFIFRKRLQRI